MKKMIAVALAVFGTSATIWADVSVYDVKFQPRTPWNGLVDISYSIACDNPNADVYVTPTAYDGDRRITLFPKTLSGDGAEAAVKPGKHTMTWDAKTDLGIFSSANFSIKIHAGERLPRYVVIDLSSGAESTEYPVRFSVVGPDLSNDICRTTELWLRLVPPGEFWMGSPVDELGREDNEDLHHVTLTKPFYMGVFEVTQKQYELVMGEKGGYFSSAENAEVRPVENIPIDRIRGRFTSYSPTSVNISPDSFLGKLRCRIKFAGVDLPSEARWEYACRAGTTTALYTGFNLVSTTVDHNVDLIAAYESNCHNNQQYNSYSVLVGTRKVGSFLPNNLNLYDMLGNVNEWCLDVGGCHYYNGYSWVVDWDNNHLGTSDVVDPVPCTSYYSNSSSTRVVRGGGWRYWSRKIRAAIREYYGGGAMDDTGFRVCSEIGF